MDSFLRAAFLFLTTTLSLSLVGLRAAAEPPPSSAPSSLAVLTRDFENPSSLCSIIGGDQPGKPILDAGLRPSELKLFAETSPENAQLAAAYRRLAKATIKTSSGENRLIGTGRCDEMEKLVNALNSDFYTLPELQCAGENGLLYRIRRLGQRFELEILTWQGQGSPMVVQQHESLQITNTGHNRFQCMYRLTLPQPSANVKNFKICLPSLELPPQSPGKIQMEYLGRKIPHGLQCQTQEGFFTHAQSAIHREAAPAPEAASYAPAARPGRTYGPARQ